MSWSLGRAALCAALIGAGLASHAQTRYRVTEIPATPLDVGNDGTVACENGGFPAKAWNRAYGTVEIPPLPGMGYTRAFDVNSHGVVAGASIASSQPERAMLWSRERGSYGFADVPLSSYATGINDSGTVVGDSTDFQNNVSEGFVWSQQAGLRLLDRLPWAEAATTKHINASGTILGYNLSVARQRVPVIWHTDGEIEELGLMAGATQTDAYKISDDGWVAGSGFGPSIGLVGFARRPDGTFLSIENPVTPGYATQAGAINASHEVTGWLTYAGGGRAGFVWSPEDGTRVLNDLLLPGQGGWDLQYAYDINDHGQIVGSGLYNGQITGYILDPVPEPSLLLALPLALLALRRRRR